MPLFSPPRLRAFSVRSVNVKTEIIDQPAGTPGCLSTNAN